MLIFFFALSLAVLISINSKARLLKLSLLLLAILPSSLQYSQYIYLNGIYWFDIITVQLLTLLLINALFGFKFEFSSKVKLLLIPVLIIVIYAVVKVPFETVNYEKLKDFRPALYVLFVFTMLQLNKSIHIDELRILRLVVLCFLSSATFALVSYLGAFQSSDVFYKQEFRYLGIQTYFCLAFLVYAFTSKKTHGFHVILAYAVIIISASRMLFLISLLPLLFWIVSKANLLQKITLMLVVFPVAGYLLSYSDMVLKFEHLFDVGVRVFFDNRYGPALDVIDGMGSAQFIFGLGFGQLFHIPWFEYRDNLNPYSVQIDNLYLTFFAKYGFFTFIIIPCLLLPFISENKKRQYMCVFLLMIIFFTSSVFYHIASIGFYAFYTLKVKEDE